MPQPTARDVHVDALLTEVSVAFLQDPAGFVARRVFPSVDVEHQTDIYPFYPRRDWHRREARRRAPGTESAGSGWRTDNTRTYRCDVFAVHKDVGPQERANQTKPYNLDREAVEWITQQLLMELEAQWAASFFTAGLWGLDLAGVPGAPAGGQFRQWDQAAATPVTDIQGQIVRIASLTGRRPNKLVLSPRAFNALRNHATLLDRIVQTQRGIVTEDIIASLCGLDEVLVAWGIQDTSAEGAAADLTNFILGNHAMLTYAAPRPGLMTPSGGYTFNWSGLLGANAQGGRVNRIQMPWLGLGTERIEGEMAFDPVIVAPELGMMFIDAIP